MKLSNRDKHILAVNLLSEYLLKAEFEHLVFSSDKYFDIYIPSSETRIKVFCNYSNSKNLKVSNSFETESGVLYLVVKPTRNNVHGFSCVGGVKSIIDNSIKIFDTKGSPKNIQINLLKSLSVSKFINNEKCILKENVVMLPADMVFNVISSNIKHRYVKQCRTLASNLFVPEFSLSSNCSQH